MRKGSRKCLHCREFFLPVASCRWRQRYCSKRACQQARKAENNRRYLEECPNCFRGAEHIRRVQDWRAAHPGYWRRGKKRGAKSCGPTGGCTLALQVEQTTQAAVDEVVNLKHELLALQAELDCQSIILQGVTAHLGGVALQAELAGVVNGFYDHGRRFGSVLGPGREANSKGQESDHECEAFAVSGSAPAAAGELQLGGPSSGP